MRLAFWKKKQDEFAGGVDDGGVGDPYRSGMGAGEDSLGFSSEPVKSGGFDDGFGGLPSPDDAQGLHDTMTPMHAPARVHDTGRSGFGAESEGGGRSRDVELILSKLDAIKAELDAVHMRVKQLEDAKQKQRVW
ncbi:hypothetical protein D6783_00070 [Candidatus Woesearchaeota archaeon]|nr:MAG: hypothetical protein D6783_00070 [Candidatus Woesearchaeota archaeon]